MPDVLTTVMDSLGLKSSILCRSELAAPWGMSLTRSDYAHFHAVEHGHCWLRLKSRPRPVALSGGDLVVVTRGEGHVLSDSPSTPGVPPARLIGSKKAPGGHVVVRHAGRGSETRMVCGAFHLENPEAHPLLTLLPPLLHIKAHQDQVEGWLDSTLRLLTFATRESGPGVEAMGSRLTGVIFVQVLRAWLASLAEGEGGWLGALRDRHIGQALAAIHQFPERDWTVASLAAQTGLSRSPFSARFNALVGEPPLSYLTRWRMNTATRLLRERELGLAEIAGRVGYTSEAAFSKAFRRRFKTAPGAYRRRYGR